MHFSSLGGGLHICFCTCQGEVPYIGQVLTIVSLNDKCINVYGSYTAEENISAINIEIKKLTQLIPISLTLTDYFKKRRLDVCMSQDENDLFEIVFMKKHILTATWEFLNWCIILNLYFHLFIWIYVLFLILRRDCNIYMISYAEWLSYGRGNLTGNFDAMIRSRFVALLWNYGQQKSDVRAISDSETPGIKSLT